MTETATYSKNDVFYTCSLIEYIGRVTKNHRKDVVSALGTNGVKAILDSADVFHCQSFEQSADEIFLCRKERMIRCLTATTRFHLIQISEKCTSASSLTVLALLVSRM